MRHLHRLVAGAAALCAVAVAAPAASADSIAYIKDGNVWLATPDGARQVPITTSGQYQDVAQADNGTIVALSGVRLHNLDRSTGKVLADFETPVSTGGPTKTFSGPFNPQLSPDGSKLSYTYFWNDTYNDYKDPSCRPPVCVKAKREGGTGYSRVDRMTGWDEPGLGKHSGWIYSTFLDNDTTVLGYPTHLPNADVVVDTISDGSQGVLVHNWFTDKTEGNPYVGAPDITRDGKKLALQSGADNASISVYRVPEFPRAFKDSMAPDSTIPQLCYRYDGANGGRFGQPTFSPTGAQLAWSEGDGVHVADVPGFDGGCTAAGATDPAPLVLQGGSEPDWGPADVPAAPQGAQGGGGAGVVASVKKVKLGKALRSGLKVTVDLPAPAKVGATAKAGGRTVATAAAKTLKAGRRTVTLKFTKAAKRALGRRRSASLSVALTVAGRQTKLAAKLSR